MSRMIIAGVGLAVVIAGAGYYAVKNGGMAASGEVSMPSKVEFKTDAERALYGFASRQGMQVKSSLKQLTDLGVEVNEELLIKGFHDGLKNQVALTEEEQVAAMQAFSADLEARAEAKKNEMAAASKGKNEAFFPSSMLSKASRRRIADCVISCSRKATAKPIRSRMIGLWFITAAR